MAASGENGLSQTRKSRSQDAKKLILHSNVLSPDADDGKLGGGKKLDPVFANANLLPNWKKIDQRRMLFDSSLECCLPPERYVHERRGSKLEATVSNTEEVCSRHGEPNPDERWYEARGPPSRCKLCARSWPKSVHETLKDRICDSDETFRE